MTLSPAAIKSPFAYSKNFFILALVMVFALGIGLRLFDLTDEPIGYYPVRQLQGRR